MARVHFHVNAEKSGAAEQKERLAESARRLGLEVSDAGDGADAVVSLGGDGTFLPSLPLR